MLYIIMHLHSRAEERRGSLYIQMLAQHNNESGRYLPSFAREPQGLGPQNRRRGRVRLFLGDRRSELWQTFPIFLQLLVQSVNDLSERELRLPQLVKLGVVMFSLYLVESTAHAQKLVCGCRSRD